jgi:HD-GYP domain-containing protein (c-di-GMP phosphodiesterase class II)
LRPYPSAVSAAVRSTELWAALSLATDLATGQPLGHGLRTSVLAVRLAELVDADEATAADAHALGLLHAIGSTADSHEVAIRYGDDIAARADLARIDPSSSRELLGFALRQAGVGTSPPVRIARVVETVAAGASRQREGFAAQCEVAERLAGGLGAAPGARRGLRFAFARWDGKGFPAGAAGESIPPAARLLHVARDADVFFAVGGVEATTSVLGARAGAAYEPRLAERFTASAAELFAGFDESLAWNLALAAEPGDVRTLAADELDEACRAAGDLADLKSPYTLGHARAVAALAETAARGLGFAEAEIANVRRAALLADLGRVGVSTAIWDKPRSLGEREWERVRLHPYFTERALSPSAGLAAIGEVASCHQERLDGSGYHRGLAASEQPMAARVLAAADAFAAMVEPRPHRPALSPEAAARELGGEVRDERIDRDAARAVLAATGGRAARGGERPAGLDDRDAQVLRLAARGGTNRAIAAELGLRPKDVEALVDEVYAKVGVASRPAAALFAVRHGLLPDDPRTRA